MGARDFRPGKLSPVRGGAGQGAVADTVQAVFGPAPVLLRGRRTEDWKIAIDLGAIRIDDDAVLGLGQS